MSSLGRNTARQSSALSYSNTNLSPAGLTCYGPAKLESNSLAAVKMQDRTEKLTSWQYCRISSFLPKQLLVPEVSGSHFPVWIFTCIFSFPQNIAIWGSATAKPVPALAASAYEDKPNQNTLIKAEQLKEPETFWHLLRELPLNPDIRGFLQIYFVTIFLKVGKPTPSFHQSVCFSKLCFYYCNNKLPKTKPSNWHLKVAPTKAKIGIWKKLNWYLKIHN